MVSMEKAQFIEIGLNQERYALQIEEIQEIIKMQAYTVIPSSKDYITGVINLRGSIVPILNLKLRLHMQLSPYNRHTRIIIVKLNETKIGLIVDEVFRVISFNEIQHRSEGAQALEQSYVIGIGQSEDNLVSLLNLEVILDGGGFNG